MLNWLKKLKFWKKKPATVPAPFVFDKLESADDLRKKLDSEAFDIIVAELVEEEPEPEWEQMILADWNAQPWPEVYFGNPEAAALVDAFKQRLIQNYQMEYLSSGGCSNVYVDKKRSFVVKIAQVMSAEPIFFSNYLDYQKQEFGLRDDLPAHDAENWRAVQLIRKNHVMWPSFYANNYAMCTMRFVPPTDLARIRIMEYFDGLLGNHQVHSFRRKVTWRDIAPINNMAWSEADNKAYIIDI